MTEIDFLVTGATGFVGGFVTDLLVSRGKRVRVFIRDRSRVAHFESRGIEVVVGDLTDREAATAAVANVATVIHIAALFRQAGLPSSEFFRVNVEGSKNIFDRAVEAGVGKVIHCSTVGVMGHIESPPANEDTPYCPGDPYQQSKMEGEKLFLEYVRQGKFKGNVIRPAMIYGPGDTRTLKLFKPIAKRTFFYVGAGDSLVHFVDVRDLAQSFLLAAEAEHCNGEVFIIAGESPLPLKDLARMIAGLMGVAEPWIHLPVKPMQALGSLCETVCTPLRINPPLFRRRVDFFTKDRSFDISKAKSVLNYRPSRPLVQELIEIIDSYILSGVIAVSQVRRPSVMLRAMNGQIQVWNEGDLPLYGWSSEQAVGNVSHALLKTEFPVDLAVINRALAQCGTWGGPLIHRTREGSAIEVFSRWRVFELPSHPDPVILELNTPVSRKSNGNWLTSVTSSAAGTAASYGADLLTAFLEVPLLSL